MAFVAIGAELLAAEVIGGAVFSGMAGAEAVGMLGAEVAGGWGAELGAGIATDAQMAEGARQFGIDNIASGGYGNTAQIGTPQWTAQEIGLRPEAAQYMSPGQLSQVAQLAKQGMSMSDAMRMAGVAAPIISGLLSGGAIEDASRGQQAATDAAISGLTGAVDSAKNTITEGLDTGIKYGEEQYQKGVDVQNAALGQTLIDLDPYIRAGYGTTTRLADMLGTSGNTQAANYGDLTKKFTLQDFWDDPVTKASYAQGLEQGTKSLNNSAARSGTLNSGAQAKALTRFGTDYTGTQAAGSQQRFVGDQNNIYNRLMGVSQLGETASNQAGGFRQNNANSIANSGNLMATNAAQLRASAGNNVANLGVGQANSIANLITGGANARGAAAIAQSNTMGNAVNQASNWYQSQDTLDRIMNRRGVDLGGY